VRNSRNIKEKNSGNENLEANIPGSVYTTQLWTVVGRGLTAGTPTHHGGEPSTFLTSTTATSVSDPKRLFPDPVLSLKGIPDPVLDPTSQVFPDLIPDPGQNLTSFTKSKEKFG